MLLLASCFSDRVSDGIYLSNFCHIYSGAVLIFMYFKKRLSHRHALNSVLLILVVSATQEECVFLLLFLCDCVFSQEVKCAGQITYSF